MEQLLCYLRTRHAYILYDQMGLKMCAFCDEIAEMTS